MGVDMPITAEVYNVLYEKKNPLTAVNDLMLRSPKGEEGGPCERTASCVQGVGGDLQGVGGRTPGDYAAQRSGVAETTGKFQLEHPRFWLYPTYVHQQRDGVAADLLPLLEQAEAERPPEGVVRLTHVAEAAGVYHLHNLPARSCWAGCTLLVGRDREVAASSTSIRELFVPSRCASTKRRRRLICRRRAITPAVAVGSRWSAKCRQT